MNEQLRRRAGIAVAGLAVLAGTTTLAATQATAAPAAPKAEASATHQVRELTADAAIKVAQGAQKEAAKEHQRVTVEVLDRSGATRAVVRGDGAGPQTEQSAKNKAYTAVSFGKPTSQLAKNADSLRDIPGTLFLAGGVPVMSGGSPIAGIGVGGAPSGDIDERIANAGLDTIKAGL